MSSPPQASTIADHLATFFPQLTKPQQRGLADWVEGVLLAGTGCQSRVAAALALAHHEPVPTVTQRLREWLRDGADKQCPGAAQIELAPCFAALLHWVLAWWPADAPLLLALDATLHHDQLAAIVLSVVVDGSALPVAWAIGPANQRTFAWGAPTQQLFAALAGVVPADRLVLVTADRGFWSPALWQSVRALGWHPLLRVRPDAVFCPDGGVRRPAKALVQPGEEWIGTGVLFRHHAVRLPVTLVACWADPQPEPWLLATDLPPHAVTPAWYGLRMQIEASFAVCKSRGWEWQRTRRRHPTRVERHFLVLAVATLLCVALGTWQEHHPAAVPTPGTTTPGTTTPGSDAAARRPRRALSLFQQGRLWLRDRLTRHRSLPRLLRLHPAPWPTTLVGILATAADPAPT